MSQLSKQMSYILRHHPESVGLRLTSEGWVSLTELAAALKVPTFEILQIVEADSKQRFTVASGLIRAAQGHTHSSVNITFSTPEEIPEFLWHGTTASAWESIRVEGLKPMQRKKVHLSSTAATASEVARRRKGPHILLKVATSELEGLQISQNGVWMVSFVPASQIQEA